MVICIIWRVKKNGQQNEWDAKNVAQIQLNSLERKKESCGLDKIKWDGTKQNPKKQRRQ